MKVKRANQELASRGRSREASFGCPRAGLTLVELLIVVIILGLMLVLALPSRATTARTQLQAALRIIQSDAFTTQALARAAPPGDVYSMIMHYPDAPLVEAWRPDIAGALAQVSTGGCCVGGDCWDNQLQEYCLSEGGKYLGDDKSCLLYGKGNCTIADPPTAGQVDSALDFLPALTFEGTFDWPNASSAPAEPWPGTPGGIAFESPGSKDGNKESFYSCGVIRNADTADEVFVELTRPDGRSWNFNFASQGLHLVTIAQGNSSDFYSQERALRFDHLGKPSRNVLFALEADKQSLAVAVSTSGELYWNIVTTNKGGKGKPDKKKPGKKGLGKTNGGKKKIK